VPDETNLRADAASLLTGGRGVGRPVGRGVRGVAVRSGAGAAVGPGLEETDVSELPGVATGLEVQHVAW